MKKVLVFLMLLTSTANAMPVPTTTTQPAIDLTARQKNAAVQSVVRAATECIASIVVATGTKDDKLGDLIVRSMPSCVSPVHAMIDAYDLYFGNGTGEAFFMGSFLDSLPKVILKWQERNPVVPTANIPP